MNFYSSFFLICSLAGVIFLIAQYFWYERTWHQAAEVLHLIFFPFTGYGNWIYNRQIRSYGNTKYPLAWYIYKYMVKVNVVLMTIIGLGLLVAIMDSAGILGTASKENDHFSAVGVALIMDGVIGIFWLIYIFIIVGIYIMFFILLTLIPSTLKKGQEKMTEYNLHHK